MKSSFLKFKSFADRDACEIAVKEVAAQKQLCVGIYEIFSNAWIADIGDRCPLRVMSNTVGYSISNNNGFIGAIDMLDGGVGGDVPKAGPEAVSFTLQQIRDAEVG